MKQLEDMTLKEINNLKEQYKKELAECLDNFFKDRPLIKYVSLYRRYNFGADDHILLCGNGKEASLKLISDIEFIKESKK